MLYRKNNLLPVDQEVTFNFMGGTTIMYEFVRMYLRYYMYIYGYKFKEVSSGGLWRIAFDVTKNSGAFKGKDVYRVKGESRWTININPTAFNLPDYSHKVVQHEIGGHGLGLEHEHINFNQGIEFTPKYFSSESAYQNWKKNGFIRPEDRHHFVATPMRIDALTAYSFNPDQVVNQEHAGVYLIDANAQDIIEMREHINSPKIGNYIMLPPEWREIYKMNEKIKIV